MGNCLGSLFGTIQRKSKKNYFTGRYKEYNVGIEFESLIEDDLAQQAQLSAVTDREKDHLLNKRYSDLIQDQNRRDAEIDAELKKQEESIRLEEEAYNAAKKESSRAAQQARLLEQQRTKPIANGSAKSSWLGDNENEWNVAGGEDDFEMFLESVKARSQSVRANVSLSDFCRSDDRSNRNKLKHVDSSASLEWEYNEGMAVNRYNSSQFSRPVLANSSPKGNSAGSLSTQEASSEPLESDSDFEPDFVAAESIQENSLISNSTLEYDIPHPGKAESMVDTTSTPPLKQNGTVERTPDVTPAEVVPDKRSDSMNIHATRVAPVLAKKPVISESIVMVTASESRKDVSSNAIPADGTTTTETATDVSPKTTTNETAVFEEDPFDFDKFLEDLDLDE